MFGLLLSGVGQLACTDGGEPGPIAQSHDVRVRLFNPTSADPFNGIDELQFQIVRDDEIIFQENFAVDASVSFSDVSLFGRVRFELAGLFGTRVASYGRSADVVLIPGHDTDVSMLFLPINRAYAIEADVVRLRSEHGATLLPSGQVLLFGGVNQSRTVAYDDTETWNPTTGEFLPGPLLPGPVYRPRWDWSRDLLLHGVGGNAVQGVEIPTDLSWRYDPADDTVEQLSVLNEPRADHCFAFFRDGYAVAMGGTDSPRIVETLREDTDNDTWRWSENVMDSLAASAVTGCVAAVDGRVFVMGLEAAATGVFDYTSDAAAVNPELGQAFTSVEEAQTVFLDGAMLIPLSDGEVWVGGGITEASVLFDEGRNFDLDTRVFDSGVAPDEIRVDGRWDHWIEKDWVVLGCGSPDGDPSQSQDSVELLNLANGIRFPTVYLDRSRPGCQVTTMADGAIFVSGGYGIADDSNESPAALIVPYDD
jgi:hypothetical protein